VAKLDPDDPRPPYQQVADRIRAAVDSSRYAAGEKLPSYDALAEEFGVSLGVVKRAMTQLREERVVVIRHGQGSYVRVDRASPDVESPGLDELRAEMANMGRRLEAVERRLSEL
jgi:GntR family transcriptional regulator